MEKECRWYLTGFCCKDLDAGRCWDCTAPDQKIRLKMEKQLDEWLFSCPYPKLGKNDNKTN